MFADESQLDFIDTNAVRRLLVGAFGANPDTDKLSELMTMMGGSELWTHWQERHHRAHSVFSEWHNKIYRSVKPAFLGTYLDEYDADDDQGSFLWVADKGYDYSLVIDLSSLLYHNIAFYLSRNLVGLAKEKNYEDWSIDWILEKMGVEFGGDDCCLGKVIRLIRNKFRAKDRLSNGLFVDVPDRWQVVRNGTVKRTVMSFMLVSCGTPFAVRATVEQGKQKKYLRISDAVPLPMTRFPEKWLKWTNIKKPAFPKDVVGDEPWAVLDDYLDYDLVPIEKKAKNNGSKKVIRAFAVNLDDLDEEDVVCYDANRPRSPRR